MGSGILFELLRSECFSVVALVRPRPAGESSAKHGILADMLGQGLSKDKVEEHLTVVCGIGEDGSIPDLSDALSREGIKSIDHVISCFGGTFAKGTILSLSEEGLRDSVNRSMPHVRLMKSISQYLHDNPCASYLFITGMLGERCHIPEVAGLTVSNSFLYGVILAFQAECLQMGKKFRINELRIGSMLRRGGDASHPFMQPSSSAYPSDLVGREVIKIIRSNTDRKVIRVTDQELDVLSGK